MKGDHEMKEISRRKFLQLGGATLAASVLLPDLALSEGELPPFIEGAPFPLEEYPYRRWEEAYRQQLKHDATFAAHLPAEGGRLARYQAHVRQGVVFRLEPWYGTGEEGWRLNQGASAAAYSQLRQVYSRARIKRPLVRKGFPAGSQERGQGEWEPISWEQAYETIAQKILEAMRSHGPESIKVVTASLRAGPITRQGALIRLANQIGAAVWLEGDEPGAQELDGTAAYYFEDGKKLRYESPADFIAGRGKARVRWHARHDFLAGTGSLAEIVQERDPGLDLIVVQSTVFDLTCEYADLVLPVHSWAEATLPDLAILGQDAAADLAQGGIKPLYDSRMDFEIAAGVAGKLASLSSNPRLAASWKPSPADFIQRVLDAGKATRGIQLGDLQNGPKPLHAAAGAPVPELVRPSPFLGLLKEIQELPKPAAVANSLYLVAARGPHGLGSGLSDFTQVLFGSFGDPWRSDPRSPNLGEAELEVHPQDAQSRGIAEGDYAWVDPAPPAKVDPAFRTLLRCKYNPALPQGVALTYLCWSPATPETRKAQEKKGEQPITPNGYRAHYRSGGVQNLIREIGRPTLKGAAIQVSKAEAGKYGPAKPPYGMASPGEALARYLAGGLSRTS